VIREAEKLFTRILSGADKKGNVQAGFLAEQGLKSPFTRDYFLQVCELAKYLKPTLLISLRGSVTWWPSWKCVIMPNL
jgi:hypothetical protein